MKKIGFSLALILILLFGYFLYERNQATLLPDSSFEEREEVTENLTATTQKANEQEFNFVSTYKLTAKNAQNAVLMVKIAIPQDIKGKQRISNLSYSVEPTKIYNENDNKFAYFEIKNPKTTTEITISGKVYPKTYDLKAAQEVPIVEQIHNIERYTSPEEFIESDDRAIISLAKSLTKGKDTQGSISSIYSYVQRNLRYTAQAQTKGAKATLATHKGKCSDYSTLMIALLRANSIPARIVSGNIISENGEKHSWVEVYIDKLGWVTFEPTIISNVKPDFSNSPNLYLTTAHNLISTTIVQMQITYSKDKKPHLTPSLMLQEETKFFDKDNKPIQL